MLKFVNEGAVSYEQRAVNRELLEKCSQLIAHRSKLLCAICVLCEKVLNILYINPRTDLTKILSFLVYS